MNSLYRRHQLIIIDIFHSKLILVRYLEKCYCAYNIFEYFGNIFLVSVCVVCVLLYIYVKSSSLSPRERLQDYTPTLAFSRTVVFQLNNFCHNYVKGNLDRNGLML